MFLTMDDEHGLFEVTLFPNLSRRHKCGFSHYGPYIVTGKVENQYDSLSVIAQSIEYFDVSPGDVEARLQSGPHDG